jgi:DnaJ-class molecular chaperone
VIPCIICSGKGRRWTGWSWVMCLDCQGTGRVKHCVACNGKGRLWLGGDTYIECQNCLGRGGAVKKQRKIYVTLNGTRWS